MIFYTYVYKDYIVCAPVAVAEQSKAWTVFDRSEAVTAGSNASSGAWMFNGVFVLSCV
jgi:hypothetical protein